jgi:hypothetical protein
MRLGVRVVAAAVVVLVGACGAAVVALAVGVEGGQAVGVAGVVAAALAVAVTPLVQRHEPPPAVDPEPDPTVTVPPAPEQARPAGIVVGDIPGEAVAWQDRSGPLDRLRHLADGGRPAVVTAVTGQRGIGKTQVSAAYARQRIAQGWPVVVWISAETEVSLLTGLDRLAGEAGVRQPGADLAESVRAAVVWLRSHPGPCLLVYDNADDPELVGAHTPTVGRVQTVVTTTDRRFDNVGVTVEVDLFTESEAVAYLRERTLLVDDGEPGGWPSSSDGCRWRWRRPAR